MPHWLGKRYETFYSNTYIYMKKLFRTISKTKTSQVQEHTFTTVLFH